MDMSCGTSCPPLKKDMVGTFHNVSHTRAGIKEPHFIFEDNGFIIELSFILERDDLFAEIKD